MTRDNAAPDRTPLWRYAAITAIVLAVIAVPHLADEARPVLTLVFLSFLLAAGLEPIVARLARRMRRGAAVAIVVATGKPAPHRDHHHRHRPAIQQLGELATAAPYVLSRIADELGDGVIGRYLSEEDVAQGWQRALTNLPDVLSSSLDIVFGLISRICGRSVRRYHRRRADHLLHARHAPHHRPGRRHPR